MITKTLQRNIPKGWQVRQFNDCVDLPAKLRGLKNSEYKVKGEYPIFDQAKEYISGYTDDKSLLNEKYPAILFGDHTRVLKYIKSPFVLGADGTKVFWSKVDVDPSFLYYSLLNLNIPNTGYNRHFKFLKDSNILLPEKAEQKKIAEILGSVDDEITKTEEIITATEKLRTGLLQKLFSKGVGHNSFKTTKFGKIPTAWTLLTLGDIIQSLDAGVSVNSENRKKEDGEIGVLKTSAVTFGIFDPLEHKTVLNEEKQRVRVSVKKDRIIISRMNTLALVGANAYVEEAHDDLYLPDRLWQIEPKDDSKISMKWLSYILGSMWGKGIFSELASGTSASMKNLSKDKILTLKIALPSLDEQQEIVDILTSVDDKIAIHKRIKSNLLLLKKGLMQDLLTGKVRTI